MNGYNFTERVRRVLAMARDEAVRMHHEYVGTEHILLGIAREGSGVASAVLDALDARSDAIIAKVETVVRAGPSGRHVGPDLPYTSRAKKVLELAMSETRALRHSYVGTEHLLLGVIAEQKGIGAQVLSEFGVTLDKARAQVLALISTREDRARSADPAGTHPTTPGYARSRSPYGVALVEDFTGRARDALRAAYDLAATRDHGAVGLIHILAALASREDGMAAVLLDQVAGSRKIVAAALEERMPEAETGADRRSLQLSPEAQQALDDALLEASKDGHRRAGTQHLLLAVLEVLPLPLAAACAQLGLTAKATRIVYERMRE
jgi:ATP-dependent Clp protease ATP-binding subunit ClpA